MNMLLIEQDETDAKLFTLALQETRSNVRLSTVANVPAGIDYVLGKGAYADRRQYPFPNIIVLGLLFLVTSGVDFVKWCRATQVCRHLPVVVLTGALEREIIVEEALESGADRLYFKPGDFGVLTNIVREIHELGKERREATRALPPSLRHQ